MNKTSLCRRQASRLRFLKIGAVAIALLFASAFIALSAQGIEKHEPISTTLGALPFVGLGALMFREPDKGGGGGGASAENTPPAWAPSSEAAPEMTGESLEQKVESGQSIIGTLFGHLTSAFAAFKKLQGTHATLEGQFTALEQAAQAEKEEHAKTKGLLETEKNAHTQTKSELETANKNVARLESLCGVKGINKDQVVAPDAGKGAGSDKAQEYLALKKQESAGQVERGTASKFYRANKKEIDASK
jgi:hypothetical protein